MLRDGAITFLWNKKKLTVKSWDKNTIIELIDEIIKKINTDTD